MPLSARLRRGQQMRRGGGGGGVGVVVRVLAAELRELREVRWPWCALPVSFSRCMSEDLLVLPVSDLGLLAGSLDVYSLLCRSRSLQVNTHISVSPLQTCPYSIPDVFT